MHFPFSGAGLPNPGPTALYEAETRRQYRDLAKRAIHDDRPTSSLIVPTYLSGALLPRRCKPLQSTRC